MKKLLILTFVLVMLFSVTSISFGAEYSYIMGGRYYGYFSSIDGDRGFNPAPGVDAWDTILGATVKKDNTWASIKFIADSWNQKIYHSFGIDNIAGSPLSIGFDSHDSGTANLGQQFMGDLFNDFKADPFFNTCDMAGSFNFKFITDSFEARAETKVYDANGATDNTSANPDNNYAEAYALALIFKNDLGKFYIGGKSVAGVEDPNIIIGTDLQISDAMGLKLDAWANKSGINNQGQFKEAFWGGNDGGHTTVQATLTYNQFTGQLMFSQPEADLEDVIGVGASYQINKLLVGAKYFVVDEDVYDDGFFDAYGLYNLGAFDVKLGVSNARFPFGHAGDKNEGGNYNDDQAKLEDDAFVYLGFHFEF